MPVPPKNKIDYAGATEEDFAKWLTKRGGDLMANQYAARDIFKYGDFESLGASAFGGEGVRELLDFLQERQGFNDSPNPRQKGKPGWATPKPAKLISPFGK